MTEKITLELTLEELKLIDKYVDYGEETKELFDKVKQAYPQPRMEHQESGTVDKVEFLDRMDISTENTISFYSPKHSNWKCYLFGNRPGGNGIVYIPQEGKVPNRFVRFMMRICFDCLWVNEK